MSYKERINKFQHKQRFDEHIECLNEHLSKYFKDEEISVFHELVSLDFHLDIYFIKPIDRDYNILLTSGMSLFAMTVDEGIKDPEIYQFAELMILLPKSIEFGKVHTGQEENGWIISMLKQSARFPHHYDTFLAIGHTLQATEDMQPYGTGTEFTGCVILPSMTFDEDFTAFHCNEKMINIRSLLPLYKNELELKLKNGFEALVDLLIKENTREVLDPKRGNLLKEKGSWNPFKR